MHSSAFRSFRVSSIVVFFVAGLSCAVPALAAELSIQYQLIAQSNSTAIPGGSGTMNNFGQFPAIDDNGNVVFIASGGTGGTNNQVGFYTYINNSLQKVADLNTLVPGGSGAKFSGFLGDDVDIDQGRVAFRGYRTTGSSQLLGLYSNVAQASASTLVEIVKFDGIDWSDGSHPWVDGNVVAMRGRRLVPQDHRTILRWNGGTNTKTYVSPGSGYVFGLSTQASISGNANIFIRGGSGGVELAVSQGTNFETIVKHGITPMPGLSGTVFSQVYSYPKVDRGGLDLVFRGYGSQKEGVYKRVSGGPLLKVADNTTVIPGTSGDVFKIFSDNGFSLANSQVLFLGNGQYFLNGLYTDIGGELSVLLDDNNNNSIQIGSTTKQVSAMQIGSKSFAYTPSGYMAVFKAWFTDGSTAIIRATINGSAPSNDSFTVYKDFSDNNAGSVSISLSCTSGTVTNNPRTASEASPAVFNISGASAGATCTAIENTVPSGYTANQTDCQDGDPLNSSCTIINNKVTQSTDRFWVFKNFTDDNSASVTVTLSCTSGTVTNNPQLASEASAAVFNISGASPGATCIANEYPVPAGYSKYEVDCKDGDPINGYCTIHNIPGASTSTFKVYKDFSDNNTSSVSITASCSSGSVTNNPQLAAEGSPATFNISGASAGATCTAVETTVPSGYTANQSDCQDGDPVNGSCTIVNSQTVSANTFTVYKDFSDNNSASVSIILSCSSGTVTNNPRTASESSPAVFNVSNASPNTTCTAVESSVPAGYTVNQTGCQDGDPLNGSCTIINTRNINSFTVFKDFSDNNTASVSVTLTCSSGTVTNNPRFASEASPAVFNISGAAAGATCTAVENTVPSGYTANQTACQDGDPLNGSCTIVNNVEELGEEEVIMKDDFEDGDAIGWSATGSAAIDGILAIGQYSLRHGTATVSERSISTVGFAGVTVTMHLAGSSLKKNGDCFAELSIDSGDSWLPVVQVSPGQDSGAFLSGTVSPTGADDNLDLRLRFRNAGKGKGGYCYGDEVEVVGIHF